jgi:nucleotide-binding universal stress UspA family protein
MKSRTNKQPFNILLATDGSEHALAAARLANDLALPPGSSITILAVLIPREASSYSMLEGALEQTRAMIQNQDSTVFTELQTGYPAEVIHEYSQEHNIDLIILGAKGLRHTLGILLGGVAQQVVEYTQVPVLVVRAPYHGLNRIVAAIDESGCSQHVLEFLSGSGFHLPLPLPKAAKISVVHVLPPVAVYPHYMPSMHAGQIFVPPDEELDIRREEDKTRGKELLKRAVEGLEQASIEANTDLLTGDAATEIIEYAMRKKVDLILVGSRGLSAARAWLLGSVSRKLVHYAGCSVLVVK